MRKYVWLLLLGIPPWVAVQFEAQKWFVMLAAVPFFLFAMTLGDPDEDLLGEASGKFRKVVLVVIGAGTIVLGSVLFILWTVFFPAT